MKGQLRERLLDLFMFVNSLAAILGGLFALGWCYFSLGITNLMPYILFTGLIFMGAAGLRNYRKEVEL